MNAATQGAALAAPIKHKTLIAKFAEKYTIEPDKLLTILKATAFKVSQGEVSNEQMGALLVVADQYGLNPFTREIFAFEDKFKGIVPVVSVDGWARIVNDHPQFDGLEFASGEDCVAPDGGKPAFKWIECTIHRKDRKNPTKVKEYFEEVYQKPRGQNNTFGPWQSHPKRMHRHKVFIQCARLAFGFAGIFDEDEAVRIIEGQAVEVPAAPQERSAAARIEAALNAGATAGGPGVQGQEAAAAATPPGATPFDEIELSIVAAKSQEELKALLEQIGAHPDGEKRREVLQLWNKRGKELAVERVVGKEKEPGSAQRATGLIKYMKEETTLDGLNELRDYCNSWVWDEVQLARIDKAYQERKAELAPA